MCIVNNKALIFSGSETQMLMRTETVSYVPAGTVLDPSDMEEDLGFSFITR